ncbi:Transposase [Pseudomonas cichorii]|uniref:Transposase n=1 Tax=Pseudomonas cichorii TaxID=36746 RepID=A0A3M4LL55_PSECI|nr:Transposase [Pseudomonas cichorii]
MTKKRRSFSAEFKREAAGLVLDQGYSHIEASRSLGVVESALRRWINQLQQERAGVTPQSKALTPEQQKIQELEARIARLEREKLKSMVTLFFAMLIHGQSNWLA